MSTTIDDFYFDAPSGHYFFLPTGARWPRTSIKIVLGKDELDAEAEMIAQCA
jgi:hypothetical protein